MVKRRLNKNIINDYRFYNVPSNQKDIMVWDFKSCAYVLKGLYDYTTIGKWMVNWDEKTRDK